MAKPTHIKANLVLESEVNDALTAAAARLGLTKSAFLNALIKLGLGLPSDDPATLYVYEYGIQGPGLSDKDASSPRARLPGRPPGYSPKTKPPPGDHYENKAMKGAFVFKQIGKQTGG